jgi:hypothetical protein
MTNQTDSVTVKFTLTKSDVFLALIRHTVRIMWFMLLLPIVGVISIAWATIDPANGPVNLGGGFGLLAFGALIFGVSPYLQTRTTMKNPNVGGPMTLSVSESGIEFTSEHSNGRIDWAIVKGVSEHSARYRYT